MTISEYRKEQTKQLLNSTTPSLDVDCLLCEVLKKNRSWILAHQDEMLDEQSLQKLNSFIQQRKTGLPVAYIIEKKEFFGFNQDKTWWFNYYSRSTYYRLKKKYMNDFLGLFYA